MRQSPEFVYTIYIKTTPERLWQALTDPSFTRRYWGVEFETDWREGSPMTWHQSGYTDADPGQVVLRSEPFRHLAYSWHTITPDENRWSTVYTDEELARAAGERRSRVSFELEELGDQVKLTVTHDGFDPDSIILTSNSQGWPALLSSLKTLLETGKALDEGEQQ